MPVEPWPKPNKGPVMSPNLTDPAYRDSLRTLYRDTLLYDVMPFWLKHGMDREFDGIIASLQDRWG
jgi:hypothetical protein